MATFELEKINVQKKKPVWVSILMFVMEHRVAVLFSFVLLSGVMLSSMSYDTAVDNYSSSSSKRESTRGSYENAPTKQGAGPTDDLDSSAEWDDGVDKLTEWDNGVAASLKDASSSGDFWDDGDDNDDLFVLDESRLSEEGKMEYRSKTIEDRLGDVVSRRDLLRDESTAYGKAFRFVVRDDKRQVDPSDDLLVQRYVLALMYYSGVGKNWKYGDLHFLREIHECHWNRIVHSTTVGVISCDPGMHVTEIELSGQDIQGPVLAEIGLLERLVVLDLGNNQLTGTLPPELGNLKKLTHLHLSSNVLTGTIPDELGQLEKAKEILLQFNEFKGLMPESMCKLKNNGALENFWSDCAASTTPFYCNCCNMCCNGYESCGVP